MRPRLGIMVAMCAGFLFLGACGGSVEERSVDKSGTFFGAPQNMGNGSVKTYVTLNSAGNPADIGIRMSGASLDGLPDKDAVPPKMAMLNLPEQAASTVFDHVMLNWNSHGHEPVGLFDKPHFDFHFYMTDMASVMAIDPTSKDFATRAAHFPEAKYVPRDYVPQPGPPAHTAVPAMGLHWIDTPQSLVPHKYNFQHVLLNGSWDGRYTFIEPMITKAWLLTKSSVQEKIKQPQAYQRSGYFPTTYNVHYDATSDEYVISLGGMIMHQAS
jgi:hypothetical protein